MSGMPEPIDKPSSTEPPSPARGDPRAGRRRLLQGALAGAPVLMTLVSRPVLAVQCTTPSGFVSANASTAGRGVNCTGHTPAFWQTAPASQWPSGFPPNQPFNVFFNTPTYPPYGPPGPPKSLRDVLQLPPTAPVDDVARFIVAALLNAASGLTPVLTTQLVKHIWSEYYTSGFGFFSPSSGARWNHDEIIEYLSTTMS